LEDFLTKSIAVAASVFVLAYTISLGLRLHDAWVSSQVATGGQAQ
jgi:hypothetical protein